MPQKTITLNEWVLSQYWNIQYISVKGYFILFQVKGYQPQKYSELRGGVQDLKSTSSWSQMTSWES